MSSWRSFCTTIHLAALGVWAGAVGMSAATAAVAFPKLKAMGIAIRSPVLAPGFEDQHFRFAAGAVAQTVFLIADMVAFACSLAATATLLALMLGKCLGGGRAGLAVRSVALAVALASLAALLLVVTPQINAAAALHLDAAIRGDASAAATHRAAVDDLHPIASVLMGLEILGALVALLVAGWTVGASPAAPNTPVRTSPVYPEPDLLRKKRR